MCILYKSVYIIAQINCGSVVFGWKVKKDSQYLRRNFILSKTGSRKAVPGSSLALGIHPLLAAEHNNMEYFLELDKLTEQYYNSGYKTMAMADQFDYIEINIQPEFSFALGTCKDAILL